MPKKLWEPSKALIKNSNLFNYEKFISKNYKYKFSRNYKKLLNWSLKNPKDFWNSIWKYFEIKGIKTNKFKLTKDLINSKFFIDSKLNFAENLLAKNSNQKAVTFISENGYREQKSWKELNINVKKIITFYKNLNIKEKDRIAAYTPNQIETVECFLSASAIGSIWSSCSPDFGVPGVIERFSQIKPKLLIITDKYFYNGKEINIIATDDSHFHSNDAFGGWVMVKSETNSEGSLLEALKNGHYYSSQGPDFKNIKVQKGRLEVLCTPVEKIIVSGYGSATAYKHKSNMESALFNLGLLPQKKWVRITIIDKQGNRAWTNPIYDY